MDEQLIFTTHTTGSIANIHSFEQSTLRQCSVNSKNSSVIVGTRYLFIAQAKKALINVYNISGSHKRESVEQRLPIPEAVNCLEVVDNNIIYGSCEDISHELAPFDLPYLLLASTESGKLYIWELNSGLLLNVKPMAHYQRITKIKSILNGKYIITSGKDSRVIIWQTTDLITMEDPKPISIIHDHTLPVTDFQISNATGESLITSGIKLFTASEDGTIRCYNLEVDPSSGIGKKVDNKSSNSLTSIQDQMMTPTLLATFTFSSGIETLSLDPADRICYFGTKMGCFALSLYYQLDGNQIVNLLQGCNKGKLYSLVDSTTVTDTHGSGDERKSLYSMGQLVITKLLDCDVSVIKINMDGTILLIGDKLGKIYVTEIYSRQILKTLQPLSTSHDAHGDVTNIITYCYTTDSRDKLNITDSTTNNTSSNTNSSHPHHSNNNSIQKIPNLQRSIYDKSELKNYHDIWYQIGEEIDERHDYVVNPLSDLNKYMSRLSEQETVFATSNTKDNNTSTIINNHVSENKETDADQVSQLQEQIKSLTNAYAELRQLHEKLYEDHQQLLNQHAK